MCEMMCWTGDDDPIVIRLCGHDYKKQLDHWSKHRHKIKSWKFVGWQPTDDQVIPIHAWNKTRRAFLKTISRHVHQLWLQPVDLPPHMDEFTNLHTLHLCGDTIIRKLDPGPWKQHHVRTIRHLYMDGMDWTSVCSMLSLFRGLVTLSIQNMQSIALYVYGPADFLQSMTAQADTLVTLIWRNNQRAMLTFAGNVIRDIWIPQYVNLVRSCKQLRHLLFHAHWLQDWGDRIASLYEERASHWRQLLMYARSDDTPPLLHLHGTIYPHVRGLYIVWSGSRYLDARYIVRQFPQLRKLTICAINKDMVVLSDMNQLCQLPYLRELAVVDVDVVHVSSWEHDNCHVLCVDKKQVPCTCTHHRQSNTCEQFLDVFNCVKLGFAIETMIDKKLQDYKQCIDTHGIAGLCPTTVLPSLHDPSSATDETTVTPHCNASLWRLEVTVPSIHCAYYNHLWVKYMASHFAKVRRVDWHLWYNNESDICCNALRLLFHAMHLFEHVTQWHIHVDRIPFRAQSTYRDMNGGNYIVPIEELRISPTIQHVVIHTSSSGGTLFDHPGGGVRWMLMLAWMLPNHGTTLLPELTCYLCPNVLNRLRSIPHEERLALINHDKSKLVSGWYQCVTEQLNLLYWKKCLHVVDCTCK